MTTLTPTDVTDAELVARSLQGDRDAYAAIVDRHQGVVCALTYAATGDVHRSQDLAQETFLAAWKDLCNLKDPARLRAWLRGIARNLVRTARRKDARTPTAPELPEADCLVADEPTPSDRAVTREEHELLWQNLSKLPEEYREPLVLYYREGETTAAVAAALDISEDAARQRLSRGRTMLARRIEHLVDRGLRQGGPGKAFTLAVVAALPAAALTHTAGAAVAAATAASTATTKTGASVKAAATAGGLSGALLGPVLGFAGAYLGYRIGLEQTIAPEERRFMRRFFVAVVVAAAVFTAVLCAAKASLWRLGLGHDTEVAILVVGALVYGASVAAACFWYARRIRQIRAWVLDDRPELREAARASADLWSVRYRTRAAFLGLPLIDVQAGSTPDLRMPVARGWIAVGAKAYGGLFAFGGIAVAPVSFGGFSVGLLTLGGFAAGVWAVGGFAVGVEVVGPCAVALHAAIGVVAVAGEYASGIVAAAHHVDEDPAARSYFAARSFFRSALAVARHGQYLWVIALLPVLPTLYRARRLRRR